MHRPYTPRLSGPPHTISHAHGEDEQPNEVRQSMSSRGRGHGRGRGIGVPTSSHLSLNSRARQNRRRGGRGATFIVTPNSGDPPPPRPHAEDNSSSAFLSMSLPTQEGIGSGAPSRLTLSSIPPQSSTVSIHTERRLNASRKNAPQMLTNPSTPSNQSKVVASAFSTPAPSIKREKSVSPPLQEPDYSCHGRIHLPLPSNCRRSAPEYHTNRKIWKTREIEVLRRLGLNATPDIIRDDGISIAWDSATPVRLVPKGSTKPISATEFKLLCSPIVTDSEQIRGRPNASGSSSTEIAVNIPRFLRERQADDATVLEWIRMEAEQIESMEGARILKANLAPQEQQLKFEVVHPHDSPNRQPRQREVLAKAPVTKATVNVQFTIPQFIFSDVNSRNQRGSLWIDVHVDTAEQIYERRSSGHRVDKDILYISFTSTDRGPETALPSNSMDVQHDRASEEQAIRKRKRSPYDESEHANVRRALVCKEPTQQAAASSIALECVSLPTPTPTQADDEEHSSIRDLGLRFLETYFRAFDSDRKLLKDAYAANATFSYQLHDLPPSVTKDHKSKVLDTFVRRDGHRNLIYASHRHGLRAQNDLAKILKVGSTAILSALSDMGPHVHGYSAPFTFDIEPLAEIDGVYMLVVHGDIHHAISRETHGYTQVFVLKKPHEGAGQWPLSVLSQQFTIRPKIH